MGNFVNDMFSATGVGGLLGVESSGEEAARKASDAQVRMAQMAIDEQRRAAEVGQGFLAPFGQVGQQALGQLGILTDPQQQFSYLQNNPLFNMALQNANQQTMQQAAARGRISAGDTLQQLSNNVLLSAQPLLQNQQRNVAGLLDFGRGTAGMQANIEQGLASQVSPLLGDIGNARASGIIGQQNAQTANTQNLLNLLGGVATGGFF